MRGPLCLSVLLLAGCGEQAEAPRRFEVARIMPPIGAAVAEGPEPLYLNQEITVRFNAPLDPTSVTEDTVRVVDAEGRRVTGRLRVQSHSVIFEPVIPLEPDLDDGSFRPGQEYRVEVVGFPRAAAVRSARGDVLDRSIVGRFRAVSADHQPAPLLHTPSPLGFALDKGWLRATAASSSLALYFHEPPHPGTVRPSAFVIHRAVAENGEFRVDQLTPAATRLHRLAASPQGLPEWVVELDFEPGPALAPTGDAMLFVELSADPRRALRNYRGDLPVLVEWTDGTPRISEAVGKKIGVEVHQGEQLALIEEDFESPVEFRAARQGALSFEVRNGRALPLVRREAGAGSLGDFHPTTDTLLVPGAPFDRGDGVRLATGGPVFDFVDFHVPHGVVVVVRSPSGESVVVRAAGQIRIDGTLVLDSTPLGTAPVKDPQAGDLDVLGGVVLVAGGAMDVRGEITHSMRPGDPGRGSPLVLVSGGQMTLLGTRLPARTVLVTEQGNRVTGAVGGSSETAAPIAMSAEVPAGASFTCAATTGWYRLPLTRSGEVWVEALGVRGTLEILVEVAPPDDVDAGRPSRVVRQAPRELPLAAPLKIPPEGFVRLHLRAEVRGGEPLPSIDGFRVVGG